LESPFIPKKALLKHPPVEAGGAVHGVEGLAVLRHHLQQPLSVTLALQDQTLDLPSVLPPPHTQALGNSKRRPLGEAASGAGRFLALTLPPSHGPTRSATQGGQGAMGHRQTNAMQQEDRCLCSRGITHLPPRRRRVRWLLLGPAARGRLQAHPRPPRPPPQAHGGSDEAPMGRLAAPVPPTVVSKRELPGSRPHQV
jgi:hypothetical protein